MIQGGFGFDFDYGVATYSYWKSEGLSSTIDIYFDKDNEKRANYNFDDVLDDVNELIKRCKSKKKVIQFTFDVKMDEDDDIRDVCEEFEEFAENIDKPILNKDLFICTADLTEKYEEAGVIN